MEIAVSLEHFLILMHNEVSSIDENYSHKGSFQSVQELRNFLCDRKYDLSCDADLSCTFDYIKHIRWHWDITEH